MPDAKATIAVLGGTGSEGGGLALRWAHKGVIIGSRAAERAQAAAAAMNAVLGCDVLACADDPASADEVVEPAGEIDLIEWNAGPPSNSVVAEGLTSVLIASNRRYVVPGSDIRINSVPTN